jgi:hypothetical protein
MDRRSRRAPVRALLTAAVAALVAAPAPAAAQSTTDLNDWNLTDTVSTWNNGQQFHIGSTGDGWLAYRWLDSPNKTTVISANACGDYSVLGSATIGSGNTSYQNLFWGPTGACFVMRGRTAVGSGSMVDHDGRIRR